MNVNAVQDLLDHIVKKSMPVHRVHVQTMEFVLIYHRVMKEIHINACARMVSIIYFNYKFYDIIHTHTYILI